MEPKKSTVKWNIRDWRRIPIYLMLIYGIFLTAIYIKQEPITKERIIGISIFAVSWAIISALSFLEISWRKEYKINGLMSGLLLITAPVASFFMMEIMVSNFNIKMFQAYSLYNMIWYIIIFYLIFALIRSSRLSVMIGIILIYIVGMVNYLVYLFRGNPILPSDLLAWQTGMSVASSYELSISQGLLIASFIMYFVFSLGYKLEKNERKLSFVNRLIVCGSFVVFASFVFHAFFETDLINNKIKVLDFFAPKYTYSDYGTAFGFVANVKAMEAVEPKGYTAQKVDAALSGAAGNTQAVALAGEQPNIIVIMNEAYSDLSMLGDYKTNIDYHPYTKTLAKNTTKGTMYTSVFGGATSDTEYEFLTGNSMAVLPKNCVPYQQYVIDSTDSIASTLKAQGYYNIAIHPYKASGYKRDLVYPLLGFDEFLSIGDFVNPELIRSYVSDKESYHKIIEEYENKEKDNPLFIFTVTMQNHGGYSSEQLFSDDETVKLTEHPGHKSTEQYLSLLRNSDLAFQTLVDYFNNQKEHTVILLFGDHQPIAYSGFYDGMKDEEKISELKYKVPFILWANYDINEDNVDKISANYLSSYLLQTAGLQGTAYNKYLMELYKDIPVINASFYIDKDNKVHGLADTTKYYDLITEYRYIGYNDALDKNGKLDQFFYLR